MSQREDSVSAVMEAMALAWDAGCSVAEPRRSVAEFAVRRIGSYERRAGARRGRGPSRVSDLTKGLISRLEAEPELVGRLVKDYTYLAECILAQLDSSGAEET